MKIIDCFNYFDEDMLLDLRLNILNEYVSKFVICEANYSHKGTSKKLNFNIKNFTNNCVKGIKADKSKIKEY